MTRPSAARIGPSLRATVPTCSLLLAAFAACAWLAVSQKSSTFDEPSTALGAWVNLRHRDYRIDFVHPPLWKYWAALPNGRDTLRVDFDDPDWRVMTRNPNAKWAWSTKVLYQTPGNAGERFVARSRAMMLVWGIALGALLGCWAWRLGGGVAALVATALFAFDPNFLGHAPLMKNDVALAALVLAASYALWRLGEAVTAPGLLALALACGVAVSTKLTGVLLGPLVAGLLALRAFSRRPWRVLGARLTRVRSRLAAAVALALFVLAASYATVWASYGFRFAPTQDPEVRLHMDGILAWVAFKSAWVESPGGLPSREAIAAWQPDLMARTLLAAERHELLPQPWLAGLLFLRGTAMGDHSFLLGADSVTGWWYYFPLAMLFKTPTATLLAFVLAGVVLVGCARSRRPGPGACWAALCLAAPVVVLGTWALTSSLTTAGIRYVLPLYPFAFVAVGLAAARAWRERPRASATLALGLGLALAAESLAAFPDYLAFFNTPSGGARGGIRLLGDANLDSGQDLPALARWQREHPQERLFLSYFGTVDPAYYGIRYTNIPPGYLFGPPPRPPRQAGVIAVSANTLQGTRLAPALRRFWRRWARRTPRAVLGATIYLYDFEPGDGRPPGPVE